MTDLPPPGGWDTPAAPPAYPAQPPVAWSTLPPPPPPRPAAPPRRSGAAVAALVAAVVVLLAGAVAAVVVATDDEDDVAGGGGPTTTALAVAPGPVGPEVVVPRAGIAVSLPPGWVGVSIEDGVAGVGALLFPADPALAQSAQAGLDMLPRAIVLFGVDTAGIEVGRTMNVLLDRSIPPGMPFDDMVDAQVRSITALFGGAPESVDRIAIPAGPAVRIVYELGTLGSRNAAYVVQVGDAVWILTFGQAASGSFDLAPVDAAVATFRVL